MRTPISSGSWLAPACMKRSLSLLRITPLTTRIEEITPRYWSKCESKMSAWSGASGSPSGGRVRPMTASRSSAHLAGLGRDAENVVGGDAEHVLDLRCVAIGFGGGQVDLVEAGDDFEVVLHRQVAVGEGLGLDALGGVDDRMTLSQAASERLTS